MTVHTKCEDLPDTHICVIHKSIMQQCIGAETYDADQHVRNHAVLQRHTDIT